MDCWGSLNNRVDRCVTPHHCCLHFPHRYMSLKEQAEELEGEAATWQLLWFLHGLPRRWGQSGPLRASQRFCCVRAAVARACCLILCSREQQGLIPAFPTAYPRCRCRDFPGGSGGGFVDGAGFSKTTRQRASDLLFSDAALNR